MASILKVDTIQDQSGNNIINENADTITIGASGDTITVPTGASLTVPSGGISGQNYPAFTAYLSADQSIGNVTWTRVQCNTEVFDTDSAYDNSTNYRFTVPSGKAGKYLVFGGARMNSSGTDRMNECFTAIYKNGSLLTQNTWGFGTHQPTRFQGYVCNVIDLAVSDYIELYVYINATSGTPSVQGSATLQRTKFGAFRLGD